VEVRQEEEAAARARQDIAGEVVEKIVEKTEIDKA
jgi:hypothetical protein